MDVILYKKLRDLEKSASTGAADFSAVKFNNIYPQHGYDSSSSVVLVLEDFVGWEWNKTNVQVSTTSDFSDIVWQETNDSSYATTVNPPASTFTTGNTYYWRFRYQDKNRGWSAFSNPTSFVISSTPEFVENNIGMVLAGGFFAGIIDTSIRYALIVAPKAQGQSPDYLKWKTTRTSTSGTDSVWDGWTNSNNMNNTSHPAARYCRTLNINGYDDWYLPAKDELELLYRHFKPTTDSNDTGDGENNSSDPTTNNYTSSNPSQTTISAFLNEEKFTASLYWSSSESSSNASWYQRFSNGGQYNTTKNTSLNVRAVRRLIL